MAQVTSEMKRLSFKGAFERILNSMEDVEKFEIYEDATTVKISVEMKELPRHHTFRTSGVYSFEEMLRNGSQ